MYNIEEFFLAVSTLLHSWGGELREKELQELKEFKEWKQQD